MKKEVKKSEPRKLSLDEVTTLERWRYARSMATDPVEVKKLDTIARIIAQNDVKSAVIFIRGHWSISPDLILIVFGVLVRSQYILAKKLRKEIKFSFVV